MLTGRLSVRAAGRPSEHRSAGGVFRPIRSVACGLLADSGSQCREAHTSRHAHHIFLMRHLSSDRLSLSGSKLANM